MLRFVKCVGCGNEFDGEVMTKVVIISGELSCLCSDCNRDRYKVCDYCKYNEHCIMPKDDLVAVNTKCNATRWTSRFEGQWTEYNFDWEYMCKDILSKAVRENKIFKCESCGEYFSHELCADEYLDSELNEAQSDFISGFNVDFEYDQNEVESTCLKCYLKRHFIKKSR